MLEILTCILGTIGFSVYLKVSKQKIIFAVIGGTISSVIYYFMTYGGFNTFVATLCAMIAICAYSEVLARIIKTPASVILIPSTIPLLPGGNLYYTLSYLINFDNKQFRHYLNETVSAGLGIALGAVIVSIIITFISGTVVQIKKTKAKGVK